jgi:hypothetical protein
MCETEIPVCVIDLGKLYSSIFDDKITEIIRHETKTYASQCCKGRKLEEANLKNFFTLR